MSSSPGECATFLMVPDAGAAEQNESESVCSSLSSNNYVCIPGFSAGLAVAETLVPAQSSVSPGVHARLHTEDFLDQQRLAVHDLRQQEEATMELRAAAAVARVMRISVQQQGSCGSPCKTTTLDVNPSDTIKAVKQLIHGKEDISPSQQRLKYADNTLEDDRTLAYYGICKDFTLYLDSLQIDSEVNYSRVMAVPVAAPAAFVSYAHVTATLIAPSDVFGGAGGGATPPVPPPANTAVPAEAIECELLLKMLTDNHSGSTGCEDQNCVYMFGGSGAGKSTLGNFISGIDYEMEAQQVPPTSDDDDDDDDECFEESLAPVPGSDLMFEESGRGQSCTRVLQSAPCGPGGLVICDTPGFGDTGDEGSTEASRRTVNAANAVGIMRSIRSSASTRIVLLVNVKDQLDTTKTLAMQELLSIMSRFLANPEKHLQSVLVLFSHCEDKKSARVKQLLVNLKKSKTLNEDGAAFCQHAIDLIKLHGDTLLVRPSDDDAAECRAKLRKLLQKLTPIVSADTECVLQCPISGGVQTALELYCTETNSAVRCALPTHPLNSCADDLDALRLLSDALQLPLIIECYEKTVHAVVQHGQLVLASARKHLGQKMFSNMRNSLSTFDGVKVIGEYTRAVTGDDLFKDGHQVMVKDINLACKTYSAQLTELLAVAAGADFPATVVVLDDLQAMHEHLKSNLTKENKAKASTGAIAAVRARLAQNVKEVRRLIDGMQFTTDLSALLSTIRRSSEDQPLQQHVRRLGGEDCSEDYLQVREYFGKRLIGTVQTLSFDDPFFVFKNENASTAAVLDQIDDANEHVAKHLPAAAVDVCDQQRAAFADLKRATFLQLKGAIEQRDWPRVAEIYGCMAHAQKLGKEAERREVGEALHEHQADACRKVDTLIASAGEGLGRADFGQFAEEAECLRSAIAELSGRVLAPDSQARFETEQTRLLAEASEAIMQAIARCDASLEAHQYESTVTELRLLESMERLKLAVPSFNGVASELMCRVHDYTRRECELCTRTAMLGASHQPSTSELTELAERIRHFMQRNKEFAVLKGKVPSLCRIASRDIGGEQSAHEAAVPYRVRATQLCAATNAQRNVSKASSGNMATEAAVGAAAAATAALGEQRWDLTLLEVHRVSGTSITDSFEQYAASCTARGSESMAAEPKPHAKDVCQILQTLKDCHDLGLDDMFDMFDSQEPRPFAQQRRAVVTIVKDRFSALRTACVAQLAAGRLTNAEATLAQIEEIKELREVFADDAIKPDSEFDELGGSLAHKSGAFDQGVLDALNHLEFAELAKLLHGFRGRKSNADQEQYALGIGRVHKAGDEKFKRAKDIIASISEGATSPLPRSIDDLASVLRWIDDVKQLQEGGEPLLGPAFVDKWTSAFGDFGRKLKLLGDRKSKLGEWHFQQVENILRKFEELASLSFPEAVRATIEEIRRELDTALEQKKGSLCEDLEKVLAEGDHLTVDLIFERVKEAQGDFLTHDHTIRINQKLQAHILKLVEGTNTHFVNFDIKEAHGQWGLLKKLKQSTSVLRLLQGNDAEQALEEVAKQIKGKMLTPQWLWRPDAFAKLEGFYKVKPVEFATHVGRFMTEEIGGQVTVLMGRMGTKASVSTFEELVQKEFPVFARNLPSECSTFEKLWKELWTKLVETTKEKFQKTCVAMKGTMPSHETGDSIPFLLAARKLLRAELLRAELLPSCCGPELLQAGVALQEQHGDEFRHPLKAPGRAAASSEGGGDFISGGLGGGWKSTCSICNVTCNGTVQFEEHLRGAKHKEAEAAAAISSGASPSAFAGVRRAPAKGPPRDSVHSLLPQMFAFPMPLELKDGEVTELLEKLDELLRAVNVNVGVIDKAWSTHVENFDLKEAGLDFGATLRFLRELKLKEGAIEVAPAYGLHRSPPTVAKACQKILRTATQQVQSLSADLPQDGVTVYNNLVKVVIPALYTVEDEQPDLFVGMLEQMNAAENWVSRAEVQFATESQCLYKKAMGERDSSKSKALLSQVTAIMEKHRDLLEKLVEVGLRKEIEQDTPLVTAIKNSNSFRLDSVFAMISKGSCEARDVSEAIHEVYVTAGNLVADESIQQHAKTGICAVLQCAVQHEKRNGFGLQKLGEFLETDFPQGGEIVHNMPHFAEFSLIEFQKMTSGKKPADVVAELKEMNNLSDAGAKHLFVITETIFKNYEDIMRKTAYHCDYPAIVARIRGGKSDIPALVGGVLAIWSRSSTTAECQTPRRPLPAQVLAIARLLALDAKPKQSMANHALAAAGSFTGLSWLQNGNAIDSSHLAQLKTGQGKSVVLGVLATVLAVSGFHVDCVCYSAYLCERDALDFATIFRFFDVQEMVMYGTFQQLSERLVNECGDVRELTRSMFSSASVERGSGGGGAVRAKAASAGKKRILLVDEVDVFFSKDFYGETYNPVVPLVYGEIAAMQRMMWKMREQPFNTILQAVKGMDEHGALMLEYAGVSKLIDGQIQKMLRDLEAWKSSSEVELYRCYKMIDGKVAYKSGVCYSDKISYGYMTLWTYLNEQEQRPQSVDEGAVKAQFGLSIMCGRFSYAAIPKWYSLILGVTGTLVPEAPGKQHPLGSFEQAIIHDDFKIKGQTALPSVFGEKRLTFREAEHVCVHPDEAAYYAEIGLQIEKAREGRAVLIFFESEAKLQAYQDSEYGRQHSAGTVDTITLATRNITQRVLRATHSGSATLLSREHGRGLDFHCRDKRVEATGGIHVVQTFLSEELSEEIQIRGRTARQKNKGSFELVLLASDLEKFSITAAELAAKDKGVYVAAAIASEASPADPAAVAGGGAAAASSPPQTLYEFLHLRRDALLEKSVEARKEAVKAAQKQHDLTLAFQRDLVALHACGAGLALRKDGLEWKRCMEFLGERNIHTAKCRLVIATDATGSMSRTWARTQGSICAMLERIEEISDGRGSIDVKFVAYRDYELDRSQVLEASVWTSDPASLVRFVGGIRCHSGVGCDGPEAVEAALNLVNKEADPPTQVLLIADASPHMERKGQAPGCTVHASNRARGELVEGGVLQTDYRIECAALAKKGVKVNGMYIGGHCKAAIDDIAKITGGESRPFDVADAEALIHAVCEAGLKDIGGEEMVAKYRAQYRS